MTIMIALLGTAAAILLSVSYYVLFIKRKASRNSSYQDDKADGNDHTSSSSYAYITHLPDGEAYEVFLSFRGEDTRKDFTDHLHKRLVDAGVWVFRDDDALRVGEKIGPELEKAIKASKISIPIISSNYASSKWCLRELVYILECKKTAGQVVLPIFYRVDPSSVRNQTGAFETAFRLHEKKYGGTNSKAVQEWRNALAEVASFKGWESSKISNGHEAQLVEIVVTKVLNELRKATLIVTDRLVGIEDHKENILKMVEHKESSGAQAVVIHGMGGVGKTTLAKVIYNQLSTSFKHCCYLPNIRETLLEQKCHPEELQKQLISDILGQQWADKVSHVDEGVNIIKDRLKEKKVLILFDDIDSTDQLNALAREHNWFNSGSILLITTRNKEVLKAWEGRWTYELNGLDSSLSFQLFCKHAFMKRDEGSVMEFYNIARSIVDTTGGLPLSIEVVGSMLLGKSKCYWEGVYKKLQEIPHKDVQKKLKISYDALEHRHQQIFLDIACLPIKYEITSGFYMWDDCGFYPEEGIEELTCRSLIKIGVDKQVTIHDQLRDLGREIVRQEACYELGNQSRLWKSEEALEVLQRKQGTAKIQALHINRCKITSEQFKNLTKLRFLRLDGACLEGDFEDLLLELRWFQLINGPSLPTNFCPSKLVVLDLSYSNITEHWKGWAQIQLVKKLRALILKDCDLLTSTPDFSAFEKLEILNLSSCRKLRRIHPSVHNLNKTLQTLDVSECSKLEELPIEMGKMEELRELLVDHTSVREIPITEGFMTKLEILSANFCQSLCHLPDSIGSLVNLVTLSLNDCTSLMDLPQSTGKLKYLKKLGIYSCKSLGKLPDISLLSSLEEIHVEGCEKLVEIKGLQEQNTMKNIKISRCNSLEKMADISLFTSLEEVYIDRCGKLRDIKGLKKQNKLRIFKLSCCNSLEVLPDFSLWTHLSEMQIDGCMKITEIRATQGLKSLKKLEISCYNSLERMADIPPFISLEEVCIDGRRKLREIKGLLEQDKLRFSNFSCCDSLEVLPDFSLCTHLNEVQINGCRKITEIRATHGLKSLKKLKISCCNSLEKLPDISLFTSLEEINVRVCEKLVEIKGLQEQNTMKTIKIFCCNSLEKMADISLFTSLEEVCIDGCRKLREIKGLEEQNKLRIFNLSRCDSLEVLPDFSLCTYLNEMQINGCTKITDIRATHGLKSLKRLKISCCNSLEKLPDISLFTSLEEIHVKVCEKLVEIKGLQEQNTMKNIKIFYCNSLEKMADISLFTSLKEVCIDGCRKLREIKGLEEQNKLRIFNLSRCDSLEVLPDFSLFTHLNEMQINGCMKITEIRATHGLKSLKKLKISCCNLLEKLTDISLFTSLEEIHVEGCEKLVEIMGLQEQNTMKNIKNSRCNSLEKMTDISLFTSLEDVLDFYY